jgi:AMMECR1 domain-containing protein
VRTEREKWGTRRQVEGVGEKNKPVVVVDDCICAGSSLRAAFAALEDEGYTVEGAIALVHFPWQGGTEWATALGYRVKTLFDVWEDLEMSDNLRSPSIAGTSSVFDLAHKVPEGLSPADAARWVSAHFLKYGLIPTPPEKFDSDYEASGGVMVSFRDRLSDFRVARNGFYHVNSKEAHLCRDVVLATARTLLSSKGAIAKYGLDRLKLAVTLFGEQDPIYPRQLDYSRFGILIQSRVQPRKLGGALPNTQFFVSEIEQFRHARFTNAHLQPFEPFTLFRHAVQKSIESDCSWPSFGVSAASDKDGDLNDIGELLIARVREALASTYTGNKVPEGNLPADLFSEPVDAIAVSLYCQGMIGCSISWRSDLDIMIREATAGAWNDDRWSEKADLRPADISIVVSVLRVAEVLGTVKSEYAAYKMRLGKDSLAVWKNQQSSIMLSYSPCHQDWSKKDMAQQVLQEAEISDGRGQWATYFTQSWLGHSGSVRTLESGYPRRPESTMDLSYRATSRLLAYYILDKIGSAVLPEYCYFPISDRTVTVQSATRVILALESLLHAGSILNDQTLRQAALSGLEYCCEHVRDYRGFPRLELPEMTCGPSADVFLMNAVYASRDRNMIDRPAVQHLAHRLRGFFHADGAITWERQGARLKSDHDFFPGFLLRMAATMAEVEGVGQLPTRLPEHLRWYRRRFDLLHSWGMVWWQIQGWAAIHSLTQSPAMSSFVYELADWALSHQLDNGAFLVDYQPNGPGFHTACVLEGIGDAWAVARRDGDSERLRSYQQAWERGIGFVDRLIIRDEDTFAMPKPNRALGGVRESLTSSRVRIDYVAHALLALLKGAHFHDLAIDEAVPVTMKSSTSIREGSLASEYLLAGSGQRHLQRYSNEI